MPTVNARIEVSATECLLGLEQELLPPYKFADGDLMRDFQDLYHKIMERWIAPEDRCLSCGGFGECSGGSHSWTCVDCNGMRRRDAKSNS